ncbi:MAG: hypothetical protein AAB706_04435 [Patescibacteria group bacterium]
MGILEKLFGDEIKIKIMRFFLFNPMSIFNLSDISGHLRIREREARKHVAILSRYGMIERKSFSKKIISRSIGKKSRGSGFTLNQNFPYINAFQAFFIELTPIKREDIIHKINRAGKIKLLILSGVFLNEWDTRVDMLIVGDNLKKRSLESVIKGLEFEIGRELKYAAFETKDFNYRLGMYDKLIRDILDYPHETIVNRIGLEEKLHF